jgi:nucleoside-diphosphate-sugar epimerase
MPYSMDGLLNAENPNGTSKHRVLLTGGSGFLGSNFLRLVANQQDIQVLALARPNSFIPTKGKNINIEHLNFSDTEKIQSIANRFSPTSIVHCSATGMDSMPKSSEDFKTLFDTNVTMSLTFCELASRLDNCHFVHISTGLVYKNPTRPSIESDPIGTLHPYGASKVSAEVIIQSHAEKFDTPLTIIRPFSFTGRYDSTNRLFGSLLKSAEDGRPFQLSLCAHSRDHCSVNDVATGILASLNRDLIHRNRAMAFNLGSGDSTPLRKIIESVVSQLELEIDLHFGERELIDHEPEYLVADISAAKDTLGWEPQHNLAHAVYQLGTDTFPNLKLREPARLNKDRAS